MKLWGKEWLASLGIDFVQKCVSCKKTMSAFMDRMLFSICEHFSEVFKPFAFRDMSFSLELVIRVFGESMMTAVGRWDVMVVLWKGGVREGVEKLGGLGVEEEGRREREKRKRRGRGELGEAS